nr:DNA methyltransferase [Polymorphobacter sp.]
MQRLGWDVLAARAKVFADEWANATYEKGDTQTFYNEFFEIFGVKRRTVASYEKRVQTLDKSRAGFIDLFWPGQLLVEQKSAGLDLNKARGQALDYVDWLDDRDQPRYVLTCDFQRWRLLDLDSGSEVHFTLPELPRHIEHFAFVLGRQRSFTTQASVNIQAAELMGRLHDALEAKGYTGHDLEKLLVRLLFCLFADDTGIFEPKDIFLQFVDFDTKADGSDTGRALIELFDILDTPVERRMVGLSAEMNAFPYVNGALFAGHVRTPVFDTAMREMLLDAARFNWSKVSPAIFGSLFQSVMDAKERRAKGAHYTSEANILKVIGPLFLDDLTAELETLKARRTGRSAALQEYQNKLARLNLLDPACGCGNFLVIAYRELRRLEMECLEAMYPRDPGSGLRQGFTDLGLLARVDVGQFHGIEFAEFPARIAEVAMWMADHIANNALAATFSTNFARIPLKQSANIRHGDALEVDWNDVLPAAKCSYVMGNPPFAGQSYQSPFQRSQMARILDAVGGSAGSLDYVTAWFAKAAAYLGKSRSRIAFVATNSIAQGEQVAQIWPVLFRAGWEIAFAHRTFVWQSEARGVAHVHVVIVGLAHRDAEPPEKRLFSYPDGGADPIETRHAGLTAYLFDARSVATRHQVVNDSRVALHALHPMRMGSKLVEGGFYIFDAAERHRFLAAEPKATPYMVPVIGSQEYIRGESRWILNLQKVEPATLQSMPLVMARIAAVRTYRLKSKKAATRRLAQTPLVFEVNTIPDRAFLVVPEVSSERREYVPIGWLEPPTIPTNLVQTVLDATPYDFGVLTSRMHMAWLSHIGGRLKSDYRYSIGLVYNTFPWPSTTDVQQAKVAALAEAVLASRANHPTASLAQLYDPLTMPADLRAAHTALDRAVDRLYRAEPFAVGQSGDRDRVEHLFTRYAAMVDPLATAGAKANARNARAKTKQKGSGA